MRQQMVNERLDFIKEKRESEDYERLAKLAKQFEKQQAKLVRLKLTVETETRRNRRGKGD